jgi:RNA recognition motif-containing protein
VKENTQKRYSYAFLEMKDPDVVEKIIEEFDGYNFEGRKMRVEKQKSNPREFAQRNHERFNNYQRNNNNRYH